MRAATLFDQSTAGVESDAAAQAVGGSKQQSPLLGMGMTWQFLTEGHDGRCPCSATTSPVNSGPSGMPRKPTVFDDSRLGGLRLIAPIKSPDILIKVSSLPVFAQRSDFGHWKG